MEALPVERAWGELIVNGDDAMLPMLAVMSGIESLHRMTREDANSKAWWYAVPII